MEVSNVLIFSFLMTLLFHLTVCATVVVDGISEWKNPTVQVGDAIIFRHKYHYKLYIFQNRRAFNLCNFTQSTLLTNSNSTSEFTWHPSRLGFFYFSFNKGSTKACQDSQRLAVEVSSSLPPEISATSPELQPPTAAPPLSFGGRIVSSSPVYPWPFRPRESTSSSPSPSPISAILPATSPSEVPGGKGDSVIPFINSNPAVPLPTGEVDSATIRPVPTSSNHRMQAVGFPPIQRALCCVVFLMLL